MEEYEFVPDPPGFTPAGSSFTKPIPKAEEELNSSGEGEDPYGFEELYKAYAGFKPEMTVDPQIVEPHFIPSADHQEDNFFNQSEDDSTGDYDDNVDMDQQSQEYWDRLDPYAD